MGFAGTNLTFQEYWLSSDSGRLAYIEEWLRDYILEVFVEASPVAKAIRQAGEIATLAPTWQTQEGYPQQLTAQVTGGGPYTMTFSGYVMHGTALTANLLAQFVQVGTRFQKEVSGVIHEVMVTTAPDNSTLAVTVVASGDTTLVTDNSPIAYDLVSTAWNDTTDFTSPSAIARKIENTFTQIFRKHLQITETDENLQERLITDPFERQFRILMMEMANEKARAFIRNIPVWDPGSSTWLTGYKTDKPQMAGLLWWIDYAQGQYANPNIDVNAMQNPLTGDMLKNVMHSLVNDELAPQSKAGYIIVGNPTTMRYVETFQDEYRRISGSDEKVGFTNSSIMLNGEEFPFAVDRYMPLSQVVVMPAAQISYGPFRGGAARRKEIPTAGFYKQWAVKEHLWGLMPENPRWIGRIKNILPFSLAV